MEIWIKERGDDARFEAALVPLSTWQELWAVAAAAREVAEWSEEIAEMKKDRISEADCCVELYAEDLAPIVNALDALDKGESDGNPTVP